MKIAILALVLAVATEPNAEESQALARSGRATWSAFECSVLAGELKQEKEQQRLFLYGMEQGRKFIAAAQAGKIRKEDVSNAVPVGVLWMLEGPSADFMLGRIYESAADEALKDVFAKGEHITSEDEQKLIVTNRYTNANCSLVGA